MPPKRRYNLREKSLTARAKRVSITNLPSNDSNFSDGPNNDNPTNNEATPLQISNSHSYGSDNTSASKKKKGKRQIMRKKAVTYDNDSHLQVLFQMYGSVWGQVWPYCLFTVCVTYAVDALRDDYGIDLTIPDDGQTFIASLLSFFLVTRVTICYNRYIENGALVDTCLKSMTELMQLTCVFTIGDDSPETKDYRFFVAYRAITLLYGTIALLEVCLFVC